MRGQNKVVDATFRARQRRAWLDFYVRGIGATPFQGVQTLTQTCGGARRAARPATSTIPTPTCPSRRRRGRTWRPARSASRARRRRRSRPRCRPTSTVGQAFDPISGGGACATASATDQAGAATYRLDPAPAGGFTLMGSPTIVADIASAGSTSQIAARLLDVDTVSGMETLVARGLYRPEINATATQQVFQLHPNGWKFAEGHVAKLELLPADQPYGRNSNGQLTVTVSSLELRLPVIEPPGCGLVKDPAPKVVPTGYALAPDFVPLSDGSRCASCPLSGCRLPTAPGKGQLAIKDKPGQKSDRIQWTWAAGAATSKADFANPVSTPTGYTICVYDGTGEVVSTTHAAGSGSCAGKPCWRETPLGFKYRRRDISGSGLASSLQIVLKAGDAGKARIGVIEKGATAADPPARAARAGPARERRRHVLGIELQRPRHEERRRDSSRTRTTEAGSDSATSRTRRRTGPPAGRNFALSAPVKTRFLRPVTCRRPSSPRKIGP